MDQPEVAGLAVSAATALACLAAGLAWTHAPAAAQAPPSMPADSFAVHGVIVDSATGEPLPAAAVRLVEIARQDLTHDDGAFHLLNVPAGTYTIVVERLGYRTGQRTVRVGPGPVVLRIPMVESAIELAGIIVTGTMGARAREEALRPTQVVGGRELERNLDLTLAQTIQGEAGLSTASMGPASGRPVIRGLSGDRILILEDGERVGDVSSTTPDHAVAVDPSSARRIEVVRGPAALFYGSNALGGVINVVREEIPTALPDHPTGSVTLQGQSVNGGGAAAASLLHGVGSFGFRAEGSVRGAGDIATPLGELENTGIETYSGSIGAAWIGRSSQAGLAARAYRSEYGIPPDPVSGHPEGVTIRMERDVARAEGRLNRDASLNDVRLTAAFTRYDHREIEAGGAIGTAIGQNTATGEVVLRHADLGPFDRGGLGLRGQWQRYESDNGRDFIASDEFGAAVYGMEELDLNRFQLQGGLRFDIQRVVPDGVGSVRGVPAEERTFANVAGSFSTLYAIRPGVRLGASLSRAFRSPSSDELFSLGPHLAAYTFEVGNPELEAEVGTGVDVFVRLDRPGLSGEVAGFWNGIRDYTFPTSTGEQRGNLFVYRYINTDARFYGAEAAAEWSLTGDLVLDGDVSWVQATNTALDEPLPLIPPIEGGLAFRYDRERWFLQAGVTAAARQYRVPERPELPPASLPYCDEIAAPAPGTNCRPVPGDFRPTPGYAVYDASAGYRWFPGHQIHSLTLRLENLTDEAYRNHLSRIKELSPEPGFGATLLYRVAF